MRAGKTVRLQGSDRGHISVLKVVLTSHLFRVVTDSPSDVTLDVHRDFITVSNEGKMAFLMPRNTPMCDLVERVRMAARHKRGPTKRGPYGPRVAAQEAVSA